MNEELSPDHTPIAKPERETVEGRLDLRNHQQFARSRYRLLNLRDCEAGRAVENEESEAAE